MILLLFILLVLLIVTYLIIKWHQMKNYWKKRGVPFLPPHPVLGSLTFLQKKNPAVWYKQLYKDFPVPYVGIWLFWRPALVINSPDIARNILTKDFENFRNRYSSCGNSDTIGKVNLFNVNDPLWSYIRRKLTPCFTVSKLKFAQSICLPKCAQLVDRVKREMKVNKNNNIRAIFTDFTTDVISIAMFGVASDSIVTGEGHMKNVTKALMNNNWYRGLAWSSIFFLPEVANIFKGFTFFPKDASDYLCKIFRTVVKERGGYETERNEKERDLVDYLIKVKQTANKENKDINEDILISQAILFLQGGFDTSAVALTFATYELAFQPEMQERLYNEIMETKRKLGNVELDLPALRELHFHNAVLRETLRKYPPLGWLDRIAEKDYKIDDNLTIEAGTTIYVNGNGLHYDPKYYPDPEKFDPDRFMPENKDKLMPFTYMPFGEGPRSCIGKRLAMQNMLYALSTLVLNFTWKPRPNSLLPNEVELERQGLFLMPTYPLSVDFSLRI